MKKKTVIAIRKLNQLLLRHGIKSDDWAIGVHQAWAAYGYDLYYKRKNHLHIIVKRRKIPWSMKPNDLEPMPPVGSRFYKDLNKFIKDTDYDFDILILPKYSYEKVFFAEFVSSIPVISLNKLGIRSVIPLGIVKLEAMLWPHFLKSAPDKLKRIIKSYKSILPQARAKKDTKVVFTLSGLLKKYAARINVSNSEPISDKKKLRIMVVTGQGIGKKKVRGMALLIKDGEKQPNLVRGRIIVVSMTTPKLIPLVSKSKAIVTDEGGLLCHAAIISRELKIPCIIGTKIATKVFKDGDLVEVDAENGVVRKL